MQYSLNWAIQEEAKQIKQVVGSTTIDKEGDASGVAAVDERIGGLLFINMGEGGRDGFGMEVII